MKKTSLVIALLIVNSFLIIELITTRHSIRTTMIEVGILKAKFERLSMTNESLLLEKAHLSSPYRIDIIARDQLGMFKPDSRIQER